MSTTTGADPGDAATRERGPILSAVLRERDQVTALELFFDLVFVLALTQCTALMAESGSWGGLVKGLLVLGVLWWSWEGYAWLTSTVDPEEGTVRLVMFAAMAALLVAAMSVPGAFGGDALLFAIAYGVVRAAHIALYVLASRDDRGLRRSVSGLGISTTIGVGLLVAAAFAPSGLRVALWCVALLFDVGGPVLFGAAGWKLSPSHFAERHGAIIIIALGESIVAIGAGSAAHIDAGVVAAAVLGMVVAAAFWWLYFDVVAIVAADKLVKARVGREQNEMARDSYSLLHLPMVAGIALVAVGLKKTLIHVDEPLGVVAAAALLGGAATYLLAHVGFRWRNLHTVNRQRLVCAGLLVALLVGEVLVKPPSLLTVGVLAAVLSALIAYEALHFAAARDRVRHELARERL